MTRGKPFLTIAFCLLLSNCAAAIGFFAGTAAGIGGFKYYQGKLTVIYQARFIDTWDATLEALEHMNFRIEKKKHDLTVGKIEAKRADKTPVTITLKYKSAQETVAGIRVGLFGDKAVSMAIKEEIRKQLVKD